MFVMRFKRRFTIYPRGYKMSKMKNVIRIVLLVVVIGSVSYLIAKELLYKPHNDTTPKEAIASTMPADVNIKPDHVIAYYFHGNFRCAACKKIEAYSKASIEDNFSSELKSGQLSFKVLNVEEPENRHFIQDYGLYTKSLVIVSYAKDKQIKFKNLEGVWNHLNSKNEFENYVKGKVDQYLNEVEQ